MNRFVCASLLAAIVCCAGCEPPAAKVSAKPAANAEANAEPLRAMPPPSAAGGQFASQPVAATGAMPAPAADAALEPARPGVTEKGGYEPGLITSPLNVYFTVRERVVYEIQIPQAMKIYEFVKNRKPDTHDEFMREIITKNGIKLPELPPGSRYWYDAMRGELMVEHPRARS